MAIKSIDILNVLTFQRQWRKNNGSCMSEKIQSGDRISDGFHLDFWDGINVIIGENVITGYRTARINLNIACHIMGYSIWGNGQGEIFRRKVDFSLEAEGLRKLGLIWKLIRNGLLEKGTVLLWDEPEACWMRLMKNLWRN